MESNQFTPTRASEPQPSQPKPNKTLPIILSLVAIGVILLVANAMREDETSTNTNGTAEWNWNVNANVPTNTNEPVVIDNTNQPPEVITTTINTSDWKTYRNDECRFQTNYPLSWEVKEEVVKSDIVNGTVTRLNISPIKKRMYQNPDGDNDEIPGITINCYPKDSVEKVSLALGFGVMGTIKKVKIGNNTMTLRDGQPEFNPPYGDDRLLEAVIDGNKTLLFSSWGYDSDIFFGVLKTFFLL